MHDFELASIEIVQSLSHNFAISTIFKKEHCFDPPPPTPHSLPYLPHLTLAADLVKFSFFENCRSVGEFSTILMVLLN